MEVLDWVLEQLVLKTKTPEEMAEELRDALRYVTELVEIGDQVFQAYQRAEGSESCTNQH